jgi:hypothetical protein
MKKRATKKTFLSAQARANVIKFCEILDDLPINFIFKLNKVSKGFNGSWKKTDLNGATAWQKGLRILFNSSLYPVRKEVFQAIEKEGYPLREIHFQDMKPKIDSPLTKEKLKELYYVQKKSLREIGMQYGCSRQSILLLMEKYRLKRRTAKKALRIALRQNEIPLVSSKR